MPFFSVIVPAFDNHDSLDACLRSIRESSFQDFELLVADDGSAEGASIRRTAESHGARIIRRETNGGPAAARNAAAGDARGEILVFLDSDVTVHRETLERLADAFSREPDLDAVMGSYDSSPQVVGTVAAFRNLLHAHVHHRSAGPATTFWTGCGGVRRERFLSLGGFDESYQRPAIEDVEFGMRLHRAGGRLHLDPRIQVTHCKEWSLWSMIRTDIVRRACPWTELMLRYGLPRGLNFRWQDRLTLLLAAILPMLAWLGVLHGGIWSAAAALAVAGVALLNRSLFRFLAQARGWGFSVVCFPLLLLHHWSAAAGLIAGVALRERARDPWFPAVIAVLAFVIFGVIQIGGGALTAEFNGYPDESAHFMTGLMIRDYLLAWPWSHPVRFAEQYYLHYPKIALGHWPPLFYLLEAAWWLFLSPSRLSALLLVGGIGLAAAIVLYRMARAVVSAPAALCVSLALIAAPAFQLSVARVMSDGLSLLFGALFLNALVRFLRDDSPWIVAELGLWSMLALLVKGTGACLPLGFLLASLMSGRWGWLASRKALITAVIFLAPPALWYACQQVWMGGIAAWAGVMTPLPWGIASLVALAGPGLLALAALGAWIGARRRDPLVTASSALLLAVIFASFFIRAMNEQRHFLLVLPATLLLGLMAVRRLRSWNALAAGVAVMGGLLLFPWTRYVQHPEGFSALAPGLRQPGRMLVSAASGHDEGSFIAVASLRERRPGSVIARASKVLAQSDWNGGRYKLLANDRAGVASILDRYGLDTVIAAGLSPGPAGPPHHQLLLETLAGHPSWKPCGTSGDITMYCRTQPPQVPREPLQIDLHRRLGRVLREQ
jgi:glycosyltransferase involved in cell wall biosynthesis